MSSIIVWKHELHRWQNCRYFSHLLPVGRGRSKDNENWFHVKQLSSKEIKLNSETNVSLILYFVVYSNTFQIDWFNFQLMYINYWLFLLLISINSDHYNLVLIFAFVKDLDFFCYRNLHMKHEISINQFSYNWITSKNTCYLKYVWLSTFKMKE